MRRLVGALEHMGVVFQCGCTVGTDVTLDAIYRESDGVMLDTGTWKRPLISLSGEATRFGLEFLVDVNNYILKRPGSDVVVVGGGNVAMDVAITAKRLGAPNVTMVCLEQRDGCPPTGGGSPRAGRGAFRFSTAGAKGSAAPRIARCMASCLRAVPGAG